MHNPDWGLLEDDADEVLLGLLARDNEPQHHWPPPRFIPPYLEGLEAAQELRRQQRAEHARQLAAERAEQDRQLAARLEAERAVAEAEQARLAALQAEQNRAAAQEAEQARLAAVAQVEWVRMNRLTADYMTRPQMAPSFIPPSKIAPRVPRFLGPPSLAHILQRGARRA
jgi:regulator of protease activity HflC (stomatin/prohibitin superfamily)